MAFSLGGEDGSSFSKTKANVRAPLAFDRLLSELFGRGFINGQNCREH